MTESIQVSGLCINCLNIEECMYRMNYPSPVIFCEEFTYTDSLESKNIFSRPMEREDFSENFILKGLCSNCENVVTCNLQKINGNVIDCEEYR